MKKSKIFSALSLPFSLSFSVNFALVVSTILLRNISFFPKSKYWRKFESVVYSFLEKKSRFTQSFSLRHLKEYAFEKSTLPFIKKYQKTNCFILSVSLIWKSARATVFFMSISICIGDTCVLKSYNTSINDFSYFCDS